MHPTTEPMITGIWSGSAVPQNKNVDHIKDKFFFFNLYKKAIPMHKRILSFRLFYRCAWGNVMYNIYHLSFPHHAIHSKFVKKNLLNSISI